MKRYFPTKFADVKLREEFTRGGVPYRKVGEKAANCATHVDSFEANDDVIVSREVKPDGGFAYPNGLHDGLTVRDAFFIAILQGMIAGDYVIEDDATAIRTTYHMADLAIAEREK